MKYGFIGFGNLAKAIHLGLREDKENTFAFIDKNNENFDGLEMVASVKELVDFAEAIWICVKPQDIDIVLEKIKESDFKNKIFISPVAGKSVSFYENHFGKDLSIVRIMPNLAIAYGKSVTAFHSNHRDDLLVKKVKEDLGKLGEVAEISEESFDKFTAIFGSGPAFLLETFKVFKDKMIELGMEDTKANDSLSKLIDGTLTYFNQNKKEKDLVELISNVASRGGITEAGLNFFRENNIGKSLENVLNKAEEKSKEMSQ